jgi:hypothetical protein
VERFDPQQRLSNNVPPTSSTQFLEVENVLRGAKSTIREITNKNRIKKLRKARVEYIEKNIKTEPSIMVNIETPQPFFSSA